MSLLPIESETLKMKGESMVMQFLFKLSVWISHFKKGREDLAWT